MPDSIFLRSIQQSVTEANTTALVEIDRQGSLLGDVLVTYGVDGDTATFGQDYATKGGTILIPEGVSRVFAPVQILDDSLGEPTEVVTLSLISATNATLAAPRTDRISILDDETPAPPPPPEPALVPTYDVTKTVLVNGLHEPVRFAFSPVDPNKVYVAEHAGKVLVADLATGQTSTFLDLTAQTNYAGDRGLLDVALDPDFANNHYVYVFYVVDPPDTAGQAGKAGADGSGNRFSYVERFTADAATDCRTVVAGSGLVLLGGAGKTLQDIAGAGALDYTDPAQAAGIASDRVTRPGDFVVNGFKQNYLKSDSLSHEGGKLLFGPDGMLYVATGDGTSYNYADPRTKDVQSLDSLSGKILRIDPATGLGLADNPFAAGAVSLDADRAKVWQLGLRNPFSAAFDAEGKLIIGDVGWFSYEEVDTGGPGADFGWPFHEGGSGGVSLKTPNYRDDPSALDFYALEASGKLLVTAPYAAFAHDSSLPGYQMQAIVAGATVLPNGVYPTSLAGNFVFADFVGGNLFSVSTTDATNIHFLFNWASQFGAVFLSQNSDGYLYYADLISGQIGRLSIATAAGNLVGTPGADTITGTDIDNVVFGLGGADLMRGLGGDDRFVAQAKDGNDTMDGGAGTDTYDLKDITAPVVVNLATGLASSTQTGNDSLTGIENVSGGAGDDSITGSAVANLLTGFTGNDMLDGGAGDDTLNGGYGDDTMTGGAGNDSLADERGSDLFLATVNDGNDTMDGNVGLDTYSLAATSAGAVVSLLAGTSASAQTGQDRLSAVENIIGSSGDDSILGGIGANLLSGGSGDDTLDGGRGGDTLLGGSGNDLLTGGPAGSDSLDGGDGTDTLSYAASAAAVSVNLATGAVSGGDAAGDSIAGFENLVGGAGNDSLVGTAGANLLAGSGGNDTLLGGAGDDSLSGGAGNDSFLVLPGDGNDTIDGGAGTDTYSLEATAADALVSLASGSAGSAQAGADVLLAVENVVGGSGNDTLTGDNAANLLAGGAGDDVMDGGAGLDTLAGGAGNDLYLVGDSGDVVTEASGAGNDTVQASANFALGDNIEMLALLGTATQGFGNAGNNTLLGNNLGDSLAGGDGNDLLLGGTGADTLIGGADNDTLVGSGGGDRLLGGLGADAFRFNSAADGNAKVVDFTSGVDWFEFSAAGFGAGLLAGMDVGAGARLVVGKAADHGFGQFVFDAGAGRLYWDADGTGAGAKLLLAIMVGASLTASDLHIMGP